MEIKKGNRFVCTEDVIMEGSRQVNYVKGDVYTSEEDGCITNMLGERVHSWTNPECQNFFIPYSQLDKVYTKHTPLLEKIFDKYEGKKVATTCGDIKFFDNVFLDETGWFVATNIVSEEHYNRNGYTYLSEQAFIEYMDLGKYIGSLNTESEEMMNGWERLLKEGHRVQFKCHATLGEWVDCSEDHDFTPDPEFSDKIEYRLNHFQLSKAEVSEEEVFNPQPHYDNSKGSLYKVATERGWSAYTFDVVKRLERGGKKDPLRQEIEKSIDVLKIWLNELEDDK